MPTLSSWHIVNIEDTSTLLHFRWCRYPSSPRFIESRANSKSFLIIAWDLLFVVFLLPFANDITFRLNRNAQNACHSVVTLSANGTNKHTISVASVAENVLFTLSHRYLSTSTYICCTHDAIRKSISDFAFKWISFWRNFYRQFTVRSQPIGLMVLVSSFR